MFPKAKPASYTFVVLSKPLDLLSFIPSRCLTTGWEQRPETTPSGGRRGSDWEELNVGPRVKSWRRSELLTSNLRTNWKTKRKRKKVPLSKLWEVERNGRRVGVLFQKAPQKREGGVRESVAPLPMPSLQKSSREGTKESWMEQWIRTEKPYGGPGRWDELVAPSCGWSKEPLLAGGKGWLRAWLAVAQKTLTQRSRFKFNLPPGLWKRKKEGGNEWEVSRGRSFLVLKGYLLGLSSIFWVLFLV